MLPLAFLLWHSLHMEALRRAARLDAEQKCEEAERYYREAFAAAPALPAVLNNAGNHYLVCGYVGSRPASFERLLTIKPALTRRRKSLAPGGAAGMRRGSGALLPGGVRRGAILTRLSTLRTIEQFVGQNVDELGEFDQIKTKSELAALLKEYKEYQNRRQQLARKFVREMRERWRQWSERRIQTFENLRQEMERLPTPPAGRVCQICHKDWSRSAAVLDSEFKTTFHLSATLAHWRLGRF